VSHLHHRLSALIDGELRGHARDKALSHVRSCEMCRRELIDTLEVKQRLNRLSVVELPPDLVAVMESRTLGSTRRPVTPAPSGRALFFRRALVGVGSLSAVVLAVSYAIGAPETSQARRLTPPVEEFTADFADTTGLAPLSDPAVQAMSSEGSGSMVSANFVSRSAEPSRSSADCPVDPDESPAVAQLRRAVAAPEHTASQGFRFVRAYQGTTVDSYLVHVEHVPDQGTAFAVVETGGSSRVFVPSSDGAEDGLEGKPVRPLLSAYDLSVAADADDLDGRRAVVIDACKHGELMARFWVDEQSGLLLRKSMYVGGALVRSSGFSSLEMMPAASFIPRAPLMAAPPSTTLSRTQAPALSDEGWICPDRLARDFDLSLLGEVDTAGDVMHVEYTDGLSTLSVFEEHGQLDSSTLAGFSRHLVDDEPVYVREGLPLVAVWQSGSTVFTLVTDAPDQRVDQLLGALPHLPPPAGSGVSGRIGTGFDKLASAVSP
jgi:hypothetical protein